MTVAIAFNRASVFLEDGELFCPHRGSAGGIRLAIEPRRDRVRLFQFGDVTLRVCDRRPQIAKSLARTRHALISRFKRKLWRWQCAASSPTRSCAGSGYRSCMPQRSSSRPSAASGCDVAGASNPPAYCRYREKTATHPYFSFALRNARAAAKSSAGCGFPACQSSHHEIQRPIIFSASFNLASAAIRRLPSLPRCSPIDR